MSFAAPNVDDIVEGVSRRERAYADANDLASEDRGSEG
jgi:hypothetical protein